MDKGSHRFLNARFAVFSGLYYITVFTFSSFYSMILVEFGYRESVVGIVQAVIACSSILCQLLYGYLIDRFSHFRALFKLVLCLFAASAIALFWLRSVVAVFLFSFFGMAPAAALNGIVDSWVLKLRNQEPSVRYSVVRAVGSLTHAVGAIFIGRAMADFGVQFALLTVLVGCTLIFVVVSSLPDVIIEKLPDQPDEQRVSIRQILGYLLRNRGFMVLVLCGFFANITNQSTYNFYPLLIRSMGGTTFHTGLASFVMSASEFFVVYHYDKLSKRFPVTTLIGLGMIGYTARGLAISLAPNTTVAILCGVTQAVSFALLVPGNAAYLGARIDARFLASAVMLNSTAMSVSQILFNPVYGILSEQIGIANMMRSMTPFAFVAGIVFLALQARTHSHKNKMHNHP